MRATARLTAACGLVALATGCAVVRTTATAEKQTTLALSLFAKPQFDSATWLGGKAPMLNVEGYARDESASAGKAVDAVQAIVDAYLSTKAGAVGAVTGGGGTVKPVAPTPPGTNTVNVEGEFLTIGTNRWRIVEGDKANDKGQEVWITNDGIGKGADWRISVNGPNVNDDNWWYPMKASVCERMASWTQTTGADGKSDGGVAVTFRSAFGEAGQRYMPIGYSDDDGNHHTPTADADGTMRWTMSRSEHHGTIKLECAAVAAP